MTQSPAKPPREFWLIPYYDEFDCLSWEMSITPPDETSTIAKDVEPIRVVDADYASRLEQELAFVKTQWKQTSDLLEQERNRLAAELADVRKERDEALSACDAARVTIEALNRELFLNTGTGNQLLKVIDAWMAQAAALAGALEKVQSIVVEDECEECGTFKGVRYEVKPAVEALAAYTAWRKGRE